MSVEYCENWSNVVTALKKLVRVKGSESFGRLLITFFKSMLILISF
jgi:hypothetical protein